MSDYFNSNSGGQFASNYTHTPIKNWFTGRRQWWKNLPWLTLILSLSIYQFWIGYLYESNDTTNIYLRLSRASSYVLLLILVVHWLPVMRNGLSAMRRSWVGEWFPIENANALHKWLGHFCIIFSVVHGSQYLIYLYTLDEPFTDLLFAEESDLVRSMRTTMYEFVSDDDYIDVVSQWIETGKTETGYEKHVKEIMQEDCTKCHSRTSTQTYAVQSLPLSNYDDVVSLSDDGTFSRQFRINVSGIAMAIIFLIVWYTSLERFRKKHHHHFQQIHLLGYLLAILGLLHIPSLEWIVAPTIVLFVELYMSKRSRTYCAQPAKLTTLTDDLLRLEIQTPEGMNLQAGHYVDLRVPGLFSCESESESVKQKSSVLCREWHPFSLTGNRNDPDKLVLKIRAMGDWTNMLRDKFANQTDKPLGIDVRGPYASPITHATRRKDWLMVAGGIGITPFLSLLRELKKQPEEPYHLHLVWSLREPKLIAWIQPLLEKLCEHKNPNYHWHIFVTGEQSVSQEDIERLNRIGNLHLHNQRPNWPLLAREIAKTGIRPTCYVCGPDEMAKQAKRACRKHGWNIHKEEF